MGASSSVEKPSKEQQEEESLAASTGALPLLQDIFAKLAISDTKAIPIPILKDIFSISTKNLLMEPILSSEYFSELLTNLGPSIVDLYFNTGKGDIEWIDFLKGYNRCCGRMSTSSSLNILYKLYITSGREGGIGSEFSFGSDSDDGKVSGNLKMSDVLMLLSLCWIMSQSAKIMRICKGTTSLVLPDIRHLIASAYISCSEAGDEQNVEYSENLEFGKEVSVQKFHFWILKTIPGLAHCLMQYIQDRFHARVTSEDGLGASAHLLDESSYGLHDSNDPSLLTCGRAWAISLTFRDAVNEELSQACFPRRSTGALNGLLYRSSLHGKGLNRFWSNVEGYHGPLLLIISADSEDIADGERSRGRWVIGVLTSQGFDNRDSFYGGPGYLYALSPVFRAYSQSGKDKNFVYSRLHPSVRVYDPHPKPVGLAFGGTIGNERIFIDEDFARVTVRHHAVDKTYQTGPLIPNQGFLANEARILDLEAWGLAGKEAKERQEAYKRREELFSEQRRKVDLKTFASWEDSPEKMMMEMMNDPNRVQREDR